MKERREEGTREEGRRGGGEWMDGWMDGCGILMRSDARCDGDSDPTLL